LFDDPADPAARQNTLLSFPCRCIADSGGFFRDIAGAVS
jgi:hypothetical protein